MIIAGIFGPKLSGKTTLAKRLSAQLWQHAQLPSLVLDINGDIWGKHAFVTADERVFWQAVWQRKQCVVIVDEAAATIRRERELIPAFTRIRHQQHRLIVIGHNGMDLLPTMRQQFDTLYLFRQPKSAAIIWSELFADERLLSTTELQQYEFLFCELYKEPKKTKLEL